MQLLRLKLTNFKNYAAEQVELSPKLNCFTGLNGMGKTNLLDAIYYLCMSKSCLNVRDNHIVMQGASFFRLEGIFQTDVAEKLVAKVIPGSQKVFERNGVAAKTLAEHIGRYPIIVITPDDTQLATEGSEMRRRFLDNTLSQLDNNYLKALLFYNKILRQRNAALKSFGKGGQGPYNHELIQSYNKQMLTPAHLIFEKRKVLIEKLNPVFLDLYAAISGGQETVSLAFRSQLTDNSLADLLEQAGEKDRILQRSTCGIHKDDLIFKTENQPVKRFASQGQLKSFILAMKLAQYELLRLEKNQVPILLLDDIFDKLDERRVAALIELLLKREFGQIFITDTHSKRVATILDGFEEDYKEFEIRDGEVVGD